MTHVVMIGATGAVGSEAAKALVADERVTRLTFLGRRPTTLGDGGRIRDEVVDLADPDTYREFIEGADVALCTLGVGEPSKMPREDFVRIDHDMPLAFAKTCAGIVKHFQLLSSVGVTPDSRIFYMRTKGELESALGELGFERLSLFHPSMILTPTNRYGATQAIALAIWPLLHPLLCFGWRRFRGVKVARLGQSMAENIFEAGEGVEVLHWDEFHALKA